jgi:hypothetical protein
LRIVVAMLVPPGSTDSVPPLDTLVTEANPPPKTSTMPLSVVAVILPPESTLSVPPESTITPVLVCPELTLRVPPLETVGIAKAPRQQSSREQLRRGPRPPTPFFSGPTILQIGREGHKIAAAGLPPWGNRIRLRVFDLNDFGFAERSRRRVRALSKQTPRRVFIVVGVANREIRFC